MSIDKFVPNSFGNLLRLVAVMVLGIGLVSIPFVMRQPVQPVAAQFPPREPPAEEPEEEVPDPQPPISPGPVTPIVSEQSAEDAVAYDPPLLNPTTDIELELLEPRPVLPVTSIPGGTGVGSCNTESCGDDGQGEGECEEGDGDPETPEPEPVEPVRRRLPDVVVDEGMSRINNLTCNYMHWGWDVLPPSGSSTAYIQRIHRTRDIDRSGSFGAGCFLQADIRLELAYEHDPGIDGEVVLFDPNQFHTTRFDADFTSTGPGAFDVSLVADSDFSWRTRSIEILDGTMAAITGSSTNGTDFVFTGAEYARVTDRKGRVLLFELLLAGVSPPGYNPTTDHPPHGRLVSVTGLNGRDYSITYKTWTPAEITASPERQWQIDTITDTLGQTISIDYYATQQNGDWVIETITQPGGQTVDYTYGGGFISQIDYPDSSQTTITYAAGANGSVEMDIVDVAAEPKHRRKTVTYTGTVATVGGTVIPTAVGLIRNVVDASGEVRYFNGSANGNGTGGGVIYRGGGRLAASFTDTGGELTSNFYADDWTEGIGGLAPSFSGTLENVNQTAFGMASGGSLPTGFQDARGVREDYTYDSDQRVIFIEYQDSTFEALTYNSLDRVTRKRDRNGNVTKHTYDVDGRRLSTSVGLTDGPSNPLSATTLTYNRTPTDDVQTSEYATKSWAYVPSGSDGEGRVSKYTNELGNETDYAYDSADRLSKVTGPAENTGGTRPEITFTYDAQGRRSKVTDPLGHEVQFFYDSRNRLISTLYDDGTTAKTTYGTSGNGTGLPVKTIDRNGVVNTYAYDAADRLTTRVVAAAQMDGITETATPDLAFTTTYTYVDGTNDIETMSTDGRVVEYAYDHRGRRSATFVTIASGTPTPKLKTSNYYFKNQLFVSYDAYERPTYYAYDSVDGRLERTVRGMTKEYELADTAAITGATRDLTANADFMITDYEYDAAGNMTLITDPRGIETKMEYDSRNRATVRTAAFGTTIAAKTETDYDLAGNVTEVRSPRYFDSTDTEGHNKAKETWTYTPSNKVASHTVAPGTTIAATESFVYDLDGRRTEHVDFDGETSKTHFEDCCGKVIAQENPLGNGSLVRNDPMGRAVHQVVFEDYSAHTAALDNPVDAKTLREVTTKYDGRGRPVARTTWLAARGTVDVTNPPIAGLNSVPAADGLTEQYLYDDDLGDGSGLDSSAGVTGVLGGTAVSLTTALNKLDDAIASGGAGVTFDATNNGSARVVISAEGEVRFSISDAEGRNVMSGMLDSSNALITWRCQAYDQTESISGFGTVLASVSVNADGKTMKHLSDAAGRTLRSVDQLAKVTIYEYDAGGNQLKVRDPNSVGQDCLYDALGRQTQCTDTGSDVTKSSYDLAGNKIKATDAKNEDTTYTYDARGRQTKQTDRLGGETEFTYTDMGRLLSLTDAENQVTAYTYDAAGFKLTEAYPDHAGGLLGTPTYGIVTFTPDAAGRVLRKQDQLGDTVTYNYDLAGRMTSRDYRTAANSPSGTIADTDSFTYDDAGRMLTAVSGRYSNTVTYTYDNAGRKSTEALTISGQTYSVTTAYDTQGRVSTLTYPDGTSVGRTYTDRSHLATITVGGTTIDTRTYDNGGRMTGSSYNNGVSETRAYNNDNTLSSISYTGALIGNLTYGWDANKNKTSEGIAGTMSGYGFDVGTNGYDDEDRLINWERDDTNLDQSWSLSLVGDWNSYTENGTTQNRTHGPTHEMLTAGTQTVQHDLKGNITLIPAALRPSGVIANLTWDFDNRISTADVDNDSVVDVTYRWDALGRRVFRDDGTTATVYVQSGQQTFADYTSGTAPSSATYNYVYASYIDEPVLRKGTGGDRYYHRNQQYSISALTNASGSIVERYAYDAYGGLSIFDGSGVSRTASAEGNRYTYTGREWDEEVDLYYYRARMYDSVSGRFCSRDPIGYFDGPNRYSYVRNQPLRYTDAYGLAADGGVLGTFFSLIPPRPCGSASITVNATAVGPVVDDSWFATDARILAEANKQLRKFLPWTKTASKKCPPGMKCCPLQTTTINLNILFRVKYKATGIPLIGNVTATLNISVTSTSTLSVGVCVKNNCPCPPSLPPIFFTQNIDLTDNVIDGNSLEDLLR